MAALCWIFRINEEICLYNEALHTECLVIAEFTTGSESRNRTHFPFG